jgi:hypothetical protein
MIRLFKCTSLSPTFMTPTTSIRELIFSIFLMSLLGAVIKRYSPTLITKSIVKVDHQKRSCPMLTQVANYHSRHAYPIHSDVGGQGQQLRLPSLGRQDERSSHHRSGKSVGVGCQIKARGVGLPSCQSATPPQGEDERRLQAVEDYQHPPVCNASCTWKQPIDPIVAIMIMPVVTKKS